MAKKTIIGVFFIAFCQFAFCQTEILKMDSWTEIYESYIGTEDYSCSLTVCNIGEDTTINDIKYRKIFRDGTIIGAVRETTDSLVYFYGIAGKREFLLYDFAWKIGKEIRSVWLDEWDGKSEDIPEYVYATINKIDTLILEDGKKYAYITTTTGTKCIQGIGDTEGFVTHLTLLRPTSKCAYKLWCATDSRINGEGSVLYKDEQCDDCYTCNEKLAILESDNAVSLSPNPVKDVLTLTLPTSNNEIKIFDLQGKLLLQQNVGQTAEINVLSMKTGTYVLVVNNSESLTFVKQ